MFPFLYCDIVTTLYTLNFGELKNQLECMSLESGVRIVIWKKWNTPTYSKILSDLQTSVKIQNILFW